MKYIKVPAPITLKDPQTDEVLEGKTISFKEVVMSFMGDPVWLQSLVNIKYGSQILDLIKSDKEIIALDNEAWSLLKNSSENPSYTINTMNGPVTQKGYSYQPVVMMQLIPLIEAITQATDKEV